ncbi:MAG: single-stranded DNA-binding protein [Candidatus Paceibacterota bacterium]
MYINKAFIIGNLTRDPELKALPSGTKVVNFSVATNRVYKDKDGKRVENTDYHNIVVFARLGELCAQYLKKGSQAYVEGRMQTRSWDDAAGGKKYRTEIIADNVQFGSKGSGSAGSSAAGAKGDAPAEEAPGGDTIEYPKEEINPDDIPF